MTLYAIRNYDSGKPTGYFIGKHGPVTFTNKKAAEAKAAELNSMPHAPGRVYRAEAVRD
jgi:hypothetical protein